MSNNKTQQCTIFIFRRDYRIDDNPAFSKALQYSKDNNTTFLPLFIFTKTQSDPKVNKYFSQASFNFLCGGLNELKKDIPQLVCSYQNTDNDSTVLKKIKNIKAIFENYDTTPFARKRSEKIQKYCISNDIEYYNVNEGGNYLYPLGLISVLSSDIPKPYTVYSQYFNRITSEDIKILKPQQLQTTLKTYLKNVKPPKLSKTFIIKYPLDMINKESKFQDLAKRDKALQILQRIQKGDFNNYQQSRDCYTNYDGTTRLSHYHKFGLISFRESYYVAEKIPSLQREIIWNQFNAEICYHKPEVLQKQVSNKDNASLIEYSNMKWNNSKSDYKKFIDAETGYPLVDASIKQLVQTNYSHNRLRMLICNFGTKILQIDWRLIEQWMATHLLDYDPIQNNLNHQFNSPNGTDYMANIRIFSPQQQIIKYDSQAIFIKEYIPELKNHTPKELKQEPPIRDYYTPIKEYKEQRKKSLQWLKSLQRIPTS